MCIGTVNSQRVLRFEPNSLAKNGVLAKFREPFTDRLCPSHDCICLHLHNERPDGSIPYVHDYGLRNPDQYPYLSKHVIPELRELDAT